MPHGTPRALAVVTMDKRSKIETVDAAIDLVAGNADAVAVLRNARRAVMKHYSPIITMRGALIRFTDDVAAVIAAVADDIA